MRQQIHQNPCHVKLFVPEIYEFLVICRHFSQAEYSLLSISFAMLDFKVQTIHLENKIVIKFDHGCPWDGTTNA